MPVRRCSNGKWARRKGPGSRGLGRTGGSRLEIVRPTGVTSAELAARTVAETERDRKERIVEKLRERGYVERDDLYVLAFAIRDLYQRSGLTPPRQLRDWWDAFQAAEAEVASEE